MAFHRALPLLALFAGSALAQPLLVQGPTEPKPGFTSGTIVQSGPEGTFAKPEGMVVVQAPVVAPVTPGGQAYVIPAQPLPPVQPRVVQVPSPAQPLAGVTLPPRGTGDGAYNGGGVVLERGPDGITRQVR